MIVSFDSLLGACKAFLECGWFSTYKSSIAHAFELPFSFKAPRLKTKLLQWKAPVLAHPIVQLYWNALQLSKLA